MRPGRGGQRAHAVRPYTTVLPKATYPVRIVIVGSGRMGRAVAQVATERGHVIHGVISAAENAEGRALTAERLHSADVAVEFTRPDAVVRNLERLIVAGIPTVSGTTGWSAHLPEIEDLARRHNGALLHSPNFSVGVQLFLKAAKELTRAFTQQTDFDAFILEQHHRAKVDAPSGTALRLQEKAREADPHRQFPITSLRAGGIPGSHRLTFDSQHESVSLEHIARSRQVFAAGAVLAAEWLAGKRGVFTFEEMLFGSA